MSQQTEIMDENDKASQEASLRQIRDAFSKITREIHLTLFVDRDHEKDVFPEAVREVVRAFRAFTDRLVFREFFSNHEMAKKWDVTHTPCLLIDPDKYGIRWYGAPLGEEIRTFMEMLLRVGQENSNLSDASKKVLSRIDKPRKIKVFVSPTCPYCPQQAINAVKAVVERPGLFSLEIIDIQCMPDLAKAYEARSVPQTFADDILIGLGAQSEEVFASSLEKMEPQTIFIPESDAPLVQADLVIIGGGPAGLTAGIYSARSGLKTVVIEKNALGGQLSTTPIVENYPGFTQIGGKTLADIMVTHALQYVQIFQGEEVMDIQPGTPIVVTTSRRKFETRTVLLATGANHRHLGIPGEDRLYGKGVSYCATCDGPLFRGKKVVMVGGGNSAVTEALFLHNMGVEVTLIHRRDKLRAQDALATSFKASKVPALWNSVVKEIQGKAGVESVVVENTKSGKIHKVPADGVFVSIGYSPAVELAKKTGIDLTPEGYIKHDGRHRTNIPGIYSAGDVEGGYKQIVTAAGQGSEAALAIFEDLINPYWAAGEKG